jgi:hypothetical protein
MSELSDWTDFGKMQNDYVRALAEFGQKQAESVKTLAEAEKTEAEAAVIWARVDAINTVLEALQKFLARKGKEWAKLDKENQRIAADVKNVELLVSGEPIGSWSNVWVSYKRIKDQAMLATGAGDKISELAINAKSYSSGNFTDNFHPEKECRDMPQNLKYVLAMLDWLKKSQYVANNNGRALRDIRALLQEVNQVAVATKKAVQDRMDKIDEDIFLNWVMPTIGGFITGGDGGGTKPSKSPSGNK